MLTDEQPGRSPLTAPAPPALEEPRGTADAERVRLTESIIDTAEREREARAEQQRRAAEQEQERRENIERLRAAASIVRTEAKWVAAKWACLGAGGAIILYMTGRALFSVREERPRARNQRRAA